MVVWTLILVLAQDTGGMVTVTKSQQAQSIRNSNTWSHHREDSQGSILGGRRQVITWRLSPLRLGGEEGEGGNLRDPLAWGIQLCQSHPRSWH